jgi:hypothetical protein
MAAKQNRTLRFINSGKMEQPRRAQQSMLKD